MVDQIEQVVHASDTELGVLVPQRHAPPQATVVDQLAPPLGNRGYASQLYVPQVAEYVK